MAYLFLNIIILTLISVCFITESKCDLHKVNKFTFKASDDGLERLTQGLKQYNFTRLYQITPLSFVFEYTGNDEVLTAFNEVRDIFRDSIAACEPVRVYNDTLKPSDENKYGPENLLSLSESKRKSMHGFNVSEVWAMGISGKGVTVGISGIGINTDLLDLEKNILKDLCMNFLTNSHNVTPEEFPYFEKAARSFTDHGNRIASVVAAIKGNNICSAGIAYNASIVALKIFNVTREKYFGPQLKRWTSSDSLAKALGHALDEIDIFVNAWSLSNIFDPIDLPAKEALRYGVESGRRGKGSIYLVPAGPAGNELSNNINTITVGSMGRYGTIPAGVRIDSSVITVGLHNGNNLTAEYMQTTSHNNECITSFKGLSAAVAQVAGIIALCLEENPNLTKRDIEYLLVYASDHRGLGETQFFTTNGAGHFTHSLFGFGLLNALTLVKLAKKHKGVPKQLSKTLIGTPSSTNQERIQMLIFPYSCDISSDPDCMTNVEHAEVVINFKTKTKYLRMELVSPHDTESFLMHQHLSVAELKDLSSFRQVRFVSVHFWEETPFGKWTFKLQNHQDTGETQIRNVSLTLYGTKKDNIKTIKNTNTVRTTTLQMTFKTTYVLIPITVIVIICTLSFILKRGSVHDIHISTVTYTLFTLELDIDSEKCF